MQSIKNLYELFETNRDNLIPISERNVWLPMPPDGVTYRNLGTMESSIGNIAGRRLKGRKATWSKRGALNITLLIGKKLSRDLHENIDRLCSSDISTELFERAKQEQLEAYHEPTDDDTSSLGYISVRTGEGYAPKSASVDDIFSDAITRKAYKQVVKGGI